MARQTGRHDYLGKSTLNIHCYRLISFIYKEILQMVEKCCNLFYEPTIIPTDMRNFKIIKIVNG
jgi:hypothetical protein